MADSNMCRPDVAVHIDGADWRVDTKVRICSPATRGVWIDVIAIMMDAEPHGYLTFQDRAMTAALLKWQAPRLDSREIVAAAVSLHSVETRHAAWIRHLVGLEPATTPFDKPASQEQMAALIRSTHFVVSRRTKTAGKKKPGYTG